MTNTPIKTSEMEHDGAAGLSTPATGSVARGLRLRLIPLTLVGCAVTVAGYAAFERIGTRANADTVEFIINYGGGFLAIGMTESEPGFIVLSMLDQQQVDVSAEQSSSVVGGTHSLVEVRSPRHRFLARLRDPEVIVVNRDGTVTARRVAWTLADFTRIRRATDCLHESVSGAHRCGAPFADIRELVSTGQLTHIPDELRAFLWTEENR